MWVSQHVPLLALFALNRWLLVPSLLFARRAGLYFTVVAGLILATSGLAYFEHQWFVAQDRAAMFEAREMARAFRPPVPPPPPPSHRPMQREALPPYVNVAVLAILLLGFDTGLRLSVRWAASEKRQVQLEKEHAEGQLAFLRHQVSPHFFMNTLNNIHSLIDINTEEAKEAIVRLSQLMRHLLYESDKPLNPLSKELDFVRTYVGLMRLRFSDKVRIELRIPTQVPDVMVPPLLITSLLENAFKHGISYRTESFIEVGIKLEMNALRWTIVNSRHEANEKTSTPGIGLKNTRERLDLLYGKRYQWRTQITETSYFTELTVPL